MQVLIATNDLSSKTTEATLTYDLARIFQSRGHSVVVATNNIASPMKELFENNQTVFNLADFDQDTLVNELDLVVTIGKETYYELKNNTKTMESCPSVLINTKGRITKPVYDQSLVLELKKSGIRQHLDAIYKLGLLHPGPWHRDMQDQLQLEHSAPGRAVYRALCIGHGCYSQLVCMTWNDWLKFEFDGYENGRTSSKLIKPSKLNKNADFFMERYELERQLRQLIAIHFSIQI